MIRSRPATFAAVLVAGFVSSSALQAQFTIPAFMLPKIPNLAPNVPANSPTIPNSSSANFPNSPNGASFGIILGGPSLTTPMIPNATNPTVPQTGTTTSGSTASSSSTTTSSSTGTTATTSKPDHDNRSFRLIIGGDPMTNSSTSTTTNPTGTASGSSSTTGTSTGTTSSELNNVSLITSLAAVQSAIRGVRTELAADGVPPSQIDRLLLQIITQGNNPYQGSTGQTNSMWSGLHQHSRVGSVGSANGGSTGATGAAGHTAAAGGSTRIGTGTATGTHTPTTTTKPGSKPTTTHPQQTRPTGNTNR